MSENHEKSQNFIKSRDRGISCEHPGSGFKSGESLVNFPRCRALFQYYIACRDGIILFRAVSLSNILFQPWANRGDMTSKLFIRLHRLFCDISGSNLWILMSFGQNRDNTLRFHMVKAPAPHKLVQKSFGRTKVQPRERKS